MKTILAPVDFSGITDAVVAEASTLARALEARVILFTVIQPPVVMNEYAALIDVSEINAAGEKNATRQLAKLEARLKAESIPTESAYETGGPISLIIGQAEKYAANYIVMGSHGHTALYDLLVGSTTHGVLMRATCPVVIVPAAKDPQASKPKKTVRTKSK